MKYLKKFNESVTFLTNREEINRIMDDLDIRDYDIEDDGSVNIYGQQGIQVTFQKINRYRRYLKKPPYDEKVLPIKFNRVEAAFEFRGDYSEPTLTTLEGSPKSCGSFEIKFANITDLQGSPLHVDRTYRIVDCRALESLKGCPMDIGAHFECSNSMITSLEGCPRTIKGVFNIQKNELKDFKGGPEYVGSNLWAGGNPLTSLEGLPKFIGGRFDFSSPLIWDPKPLRDIKIDGMITCLGTKIEHLLKLFQNLYNRDQNVLDRWGFKTREEPYQTFLESLDYNWIKGDANNPKIDLFRLMEACREFGLSLADAVLHYEIDSLGPYEYVDLDGDRVNVWGEKLNN